MYIEPYNFTVMLGSIGLAGARKGESIFITGLN